VDDDAGRLQGDELDVAGQDRAAENPAAAAAKESA
jgi:hypothetical protein